MRFLFGWRVAASFWTKKKSELFVDGSCVHVSPKSTDLKMPWPRTPSPLKKPSPVPA
jgi:hypothetical protein